MNRPAEYQTIRDGAGNPIFAVVPYDLGVDPRVLQE